MGNKLKGLTSRDRKLWDKAHPEYNEYSDNDRDFYYYSEMIKARGYDQREDFANLKDKVNNNSNGSERNQFMVDFFNNAISEETSESLNNIKEGIIGSEEDVNEDVTSELSNIRNKREEKEGKKSIFERMVSGAISAEVPTGKFEDFIEASTNAAFKEEGENKYKWSQEDIAAAEQNSKFSTLGRDITDEDIYKVESVINKANEVSPHFKNKALADKYLDLPDFSSEAGEVSWESLANGYQGVLNKYLSEGKDKYEAQQLADQYLNRKLQNIVYEKQPFWTKIGNGTLQMLETILATGIQFGAMGRGLIEAISGNWDYHEGETWAEYLIDAINNNSWAVAANNLSEYGTFSSEKVEELIEQGGFRKNPIIASWESDTGGITGMFDEALLPNLIGQQGFTIALAAASMGGSKIVESGTAALKAAKLAKLQKASMTAAEYSKAAARVGQQIETLAKVGSGAVATLAGIPEGHQEGYGLKKRILDEGIQYLNDIKERDIIDSFNQSLIDQDLDIKTEEEYLKLLDSFKQAYSDQVEEINSKKYEDIADQIELSAIRAATFHTVATNMINGSINSTLNLSIQAPAIQNRLRARKLANKNLAVRGEDGVVRVTPKIDKNIIKKVANNPYVKAIAGRPAGEFIEEFSQDVSSETNVSAARNHIANYVKDTYDFNDTSLEDFDGGLSDFAAAWQGMWKGASSPESLKAGMYGAMGSILGVPTFSRANYKNPVTGKYSLERRNDESWIDYISRITPWSSIGNDIRAQKHKIAQDRADAKEIEEFFNDPKNAELTNDIFGIINLEQHITDALNSDDEYDARNNVVSKMVKQASMLSRIEGSPVAEAWKTRINAAASMEEGSDIANEAIADYKKTNSTEGLSDTDIFNTVKKNAQKMQTVMEKTEKYLKDAENIFPNALPATKEAYAYAMVAREDQESRRDQLRNEINKVTVDTNNSEHSEFNEVEKSAIIQFGSKEKAASGIKALEKEKAKLQGEIKKLSGSEEAKVKQLVSQKQKRIADIEQTLSPYKDLNIKEFSQKKGSILTAADIVSLSEEQRAEMFKESRSDRYSQKQKDILNDIIAQGVAKDPNYRQKVIDLARLNTSVNELTKNTFDVIEDASKMDAFVLSQSFDRALGFYTMEGESLAKIEDYNTFSEAAARAFKQADRARNAVLRTVLNKRNTENWQLFKASREYASEILKYAEQNTKQVETFGVRMDKQNLNTFGSAVMYLVDRGVNLQDKKAVYDALNERDNNNVFLLQKYIEEYNKNMPRGRKIHFTTPEEIYNDYLHYTHGYENFKKDEEFTKQKPKPKENPKPAKPVIEEKQEKEEPKEVTKPEFEQPEVQKAVDEILAAVSNLKIKNKKKAKFESFISELSKDIDFNTLRSELQKEYPKNTSNTEIRKVISDYFNSLRVSTESTNIADTQTNVPNQHNDVSDSSSIKIFGLDAFLDDKYAEVKKFYIDNKINEFVNSGKLTTNQKVYFVIVPELAKNSAYNQQSNVAIAAVVEDENGSINIGNKKYQPIGIIPKEGDTRNQGSNLTKIIRSYIEPRDLQSSTYSLISSNETPVSTTLRVLTESSIKAGETKEFKDFLSEETGLTGNELIENFIANVSIEKYTTETDKESKRLVYKGGSKTTTIITKDVLESTDSNGNTLSQLLSSSVLTEDKILNFNYFTSSLWARLTRENDTVKSIFSNLRSEDTDGIKNASKILNNAIRRSLFIKNPSVKFEFVKIEDGQAFKINLLVGNKIVATPVSRLDIADTEFSNTDVTNLIVSLIQNSGESIKWQIAYDRIENSESKKEYLKRIFESGVLQTKAESIYPSGISLLLNGSTLNKDFGSGIERHRRTQPSQQPSTRANSENANTNQSKGNLGVIREPVKLSDIKKEEFKRFGEESKKLKRSASEDHYTDDKGRKKARVTSIVREGESSISVAAQTVGNMADRMAKDFMDKKGQIDKNAYPSLRITDEIKEELAKLYLKLQMWNDDTWSYLSPGEDGEFKVDGNVFITLEDGTVKEIPVSGAMDICFINSAQDKMLIVDTKTHNSSELSEEAKATYQKQLSLYAAFVERNFGIKTEIAILDIPVDYNGKKQYINDGGNLVDFNTGEIEQVLIREPGIIPMEKLDINSIKFDLSKMSKETQNIVTQILNDVGADISGDNPVKQVIPEKEADRETIFDEMGLSSSSGKINSQGVSASDNPEVNQFIQDFFDDSITVAREEEKRTWSSITEEMKKAFGDELDLQSLRQELEEELKLCSSVEECINKINCRV